MENKEPEVIIENDSRDELLDKFETPVSSSKKSGKSSGMKALIIALAAALALGGVLCFLLFAPQSSEISDKASDNGEVKTGVNNKKEWQTKVKTDKKGKVKASASGKFVEKYPNEITRIELENEGGKMTIKSYTPTKQSKETDPETGETKSETDTTEYTIVGFEKLDLQDGVPDEIANACANLEFKSVADADASSHLSDFGLDKPKAIAKVYYNDDTTATFKVGNNAPQNLGTYVMFGSGKDVFVCDTDTTNALLFKLTDLVSLTINTAASDSESSNPKSVTVNGINFKPNPDFDRIQNQYILDDGSFADDTEATQVTGAIRGLYAESVKAVNPTAAQLSELGLSKPKAEIKATYSDTVIELIASKPDSKGDCFLMEKSGSIVYKIASASIPWLNTTREKLTSDYVLNVKLSGLKQMSVTANGKTYDFDIKTTVTKTTDDEGNESESSDTKTKYNGKEIDEGYFETFFNNAALLKYSKGSAKASSASAPLTIKYTYEKSRKPDTIAFTKSGNAYVATLNGKAIGTVYKSYIEKLLEQPAKVAKDQEVKTFW